MNSVELKRKNTKSFYKFLKDKGSSIVSFLVIILHFLSQIYLASYESQTTDEAVHISAGYTYLIKKDFRFNPEHPIMPKIFCAIPLIFIKPKIPPDNLFWDKSENYLYDSWRENRSFGEKMLYEYGNNPEQILFWTRIPTVIISTLFTTFLFLFLKKKFNDKTATFGILLFVTNPVISSHSHFVTTDIWVSFGFFISIISFFKFLYKPNLKNGVYLSLSIAFTFLSKFTAIILIPFFLVYFAFAKRRKTLCSEIMKYPSKFLLIFLSVWIIIIISYLPGLRIPPDSKKLEEIASENKTAIELNPKIIPLYDKFRFILIPKDYIKGLAMVINHTQSGHSSFLLGKTSEKGWWYYFPIVFLAKNQELFLLLVFFSLVRFFYEKKHEKYNDLNFCFLVFVGIYLIFSMMSKANLGVRHILPIFAPLIFISAQLSDSKKKKERLFSYFSIFFLTIQSIFIFPNNLSYFNLFFGGSLNGYKIANGSNLDWGQDLKKIRDYVKMKKLDKPFIEYGWNGNPSLNYYLGENYQEGKLIDKNKPKGTLIIGASALIDEKYKFLENYKPKLRLTNSVFIYEFD